MSKQCDESLIDHLVKDVTALTAIQQNRWEFLDALTKGLVLNVQRYFTAEKKKGSLIVPLELPIQRTAAACNVTKDCVKNVYNEYRRTGRLRHKVAKVPRRLPELKEEVNWDIIDPVAIKRILLDMYKKDGSLPKLAVFKKLRRYGAFPYQQSQLHEVLTQIGLSSVEAPNGELEYAINMSEGEEEPDESESDGDGDEDDEEIDTKKRFKQDHQDDSRESDKLNCGKVVTFEDVEGMEKPLDEFMGDNPLRKLVKNEIKQECDDQFSGNVNVTTEK